MCIPSEKTLPAFYKRSPAVNTVGLLCYYLFFSSCFCRYLFTSQSSAPRSHLFLSHSGQQIHLAFASSPVMFSHSCLLHLTFCMLYRNTLTQSQNLYNGGQYLPPQCKLNPNPCSYPKPYRPHLCMSL